MNNFLLIITFVLISFLGFNSKLLSSNYIAERGGERNMNHNHESYENYNHHDYNHGNTNSFEHGAAYGADRGAAYGAAYGAGANSGGYSGVPSDAEEQNMLYYSGLQSMGRNGQ